MTGPLLDIEAAALWLNIPKATLAALVTARKVPFTRPGGSKHIRFAQEHLDAIVAAGEEQPAGASAALVLLAAKPPPATPKPGPAKPAAPPRPAGPATPSAPPGPKQHPVQEVA